MTGQIWINNHYINITQTLGYDGDGQKVKEGLAGAPTYYLRSTVLNGAIIQEIDNSGQKKMGYVYTAEGEVLAKHVPLGSSSYAVWKNSTPAGTGQYDWNVGAAYGSGVLERVELDPMGAAVGIEAPQTSDLGGEEGDIGSNYFAPMSDSRSSNFFDLRGGCTGTVIASCQSPMPPNEYAQARARAMLGDRFYDLPGNDNVVERTARLYIRDVNRIFADVAAANAEKAKPKFKPTLRSVSTEENKRRKAIVAEFGRLGWGDEGSELENAMPQNPVPITVRYMNQKYVKDFLKALQEAEKRLQKADCAKLFGKSAADLVNMLENTEYRVLTLISGGPKYDPVKGRVSVTGAQTNSPTSVFINDKGPFFNNQMFVPGKSGLQNLDLNSGLRSTDFGALLLLHELGHQSGIFGPDAANDELNAKYTRQVLKACF